MLETMSLTDDCNNNNNKRLLSQSTSTSPKTVAICSFSEDDENSTHDSLEEEVPTKEENEKQKKRHQNNEILVQPTPKDILLGKSAKCFNHPGNQEYRRIIAGYCRKYKACENRTAKGQLITHIMRLFQQYGSRFLTLSSSFNKKKTYAAIKVSDCVWVEASQKVAREKVANAIRDKLAPTSYGKQWVETTTTTNKSASSSSSPTTKKQLLPMTMTIPPPPPPPLDKGHFALPQPPVLPPTFQPPPPAIGSHVPSRRTATTLTPSTTTTPATTRDTCSPSLMKKSFHLGTGYQHRRRSPTQAQEQEEFSVRTGPHYMCTTAAPVQRPPQPPVLPPSLQRQCERRSPLETINNQAARHHYHRVPPPTTQHEQEQHPWLSRQIQQLIQAKKIQNQPIEDQHPRRQQRWQMPTTVQICRPLEDGGLITRPDEEIEADLAFLTSVLYYTANKRRRTIVL